MTEKHPLADELKAYEAMKETLMEHHKGKFVLIHGGDFIDAFDTFDHAAREAVRRFGRGPYLIRQVGFEPAMAMPASVAFQPIYAPH